MSKTKKLDPIELKDKYQFSLTTDTNTSEFSRLLSVLRQANVLSEKDYPPDQQKTEAALTPNQGQDPQLEFANLISKFKKHLSELINPFVFNDVQKFLRDVFDENHDPVNTY